MIELGAYTVTIYLFACQLIGFVVISMCVDHHCFVRAECAFSNVEERTGGHGKSFEPGVLFSELCRGYSRQTL